MSKDPFVHFFVQLFLGFLLVSVEENAYTNELEAFA